MWLNRTFALAGYDYLKMKQYENMPLGEYLNALTIHEGKKSDRNKEFDKVFDKKNPEGAKMYILLQLMDSI